MSNKNNRPVFFASTGLNKAELNYPTIEKESLAILFSVKHIRPYLFGRRFKIVTDHKPLVYLFNHNNPSSRLTKFRLCLEEYNFYIEYVKGKDNAVADALSRIYITSEELKELSNNISCVLTRAQTRKLRKQREVEGNSRRNSISNCTDHPKAVELLKKPEECVELVEVEKNKIKNVKTRESYLTSKKGYLMLVPSLNKLFIHPDARSVITPREMRYC